jgi:putative acetyltransferase
VDGEIAGFGELKPDGHIDCFYCHHRWQRRGVGSRIYQGLERAARKSGLARVFTEASLTARPFFERMGFRILKQQTVLCRGVGLTNFAMEKELGPELAGSTAAKEA